MALEKVKCPNCGGALEMDGIAEKATCLYCGSEFSTASAVERIRIEGIATIDTIMLAAQRVMEYENDYDKAARKYREALELKPDDFRALWGLYLCEAHAIEYAYMRHGYVKVPGDAKECMTNIARRYGSHAADCAPDLKIREYYNSQMQRDIARYAPKPKKKGLFSRFKRN